jgi:hypothetical protein
MEFSVVSSQSSVRNKKINEIVFLGPEIKTKAAIDFSSLSLHLRQKSKNDFILQSEIGKQEKLQLFSFASFTQN